MLVIDLQLEARQPEVTLGKTPFGLAAVRMSKTIGVHDGGGTIRNSEGAVNEKEVFWKPARWVDYSGLNAPNVFEGATLMDHPRNPGHPAIFQVRDDGWMGASFTHAAPLTLKPGAPLETFAMVTVPPNRLIGTITDRMPAVIPYASWGKWLGEGGASVAELKTLLVPFEGNWTMQEELPRRPKRPSPPAEPDQTTLF